MWLKNHLIPDAKQAHKMWSVQASLFSAAVSGLWAATPAFQAYLPPVKFAMLCVLVSVLAVGGRLLNQGLGADKDASPS